MDVAFDCKGKVLAQVIAWAGTHPIISVDGELKALAKGLAGSYEVPEDMTFSQWADNQEVFRVLSKGGFSETRVDVWLSLGTLSPMRAWFAANLLQYQGKASFFRSLQGQIESWCNTSPLKREFSDPLSKKQWDMLKEDTVRICQAREEVLHVTELKDLMPFGKAG
jgi:hypothetical protein